MKDYPACFENNCGIVLIPTSSIECSDSKIKWTYLWKGINF